ncbi:hypothetical protein OG372_17530 [Streptomyces sp. NBC_01020]|uniref:hypothetical protein n=1 Tax=unclassified Streptomyces TaxID=2593676 RepID=UPI002E1D6773|nr:hypothetical protein OG372_17530 [Streptomyces sp. NBC_01020]WSX72389.1 hypothetical protein OG221_19920 [Streptomyces sp. NBC_00932]
MPESERESEPANAARSKAGDEPAGRSAYEAENRPEYAPAYEPEHAPACQPGAASGPGGAGDTDDQESAADRRRRRAQFLRELNEAKELRDRVQPRRAKVARLRQAMRMRTFRW